MRILLRHLDDLVSAWLPRTSIIGTSNITRISTLQLNYYHNTTIQPFWLLFIYLKSKKSQFQKVFPNGLESLSAFIWKCLTMQGGRLYGVHHSAWAKSVLRLMPDLSAKSKTPGVRRVTSVPPVRNWNWINCCLGASVGKGVKMKMIFTAAPSPEDPG